MIPLLIIGIILYLFIKLASSAPAEIHKPVEIPPVTINPEPTPVQLPDPKPTPFPIESILLAKKGSLKESWEYKLEGECELIAKTYQKEYGGKLVFIAPYKSSTGAWIACDFCGQWSNLIIRDNKSFYLDYGFQMVFENKADFESFFTEVMKAKHNSADVAVKTYVYGVDQMPYSITWNYP